MAALGELTPKELRAGVGKQVKESKTAGFLNFVKTKMKSSFSAASATAYCHRCDQQCPVAPEVGKNEFVFEIISPTCTPWSLRGSQLGWLDEANLPLLMWPWELQARPCHLWLLECTPTIDLDYIREVAGATYKVEPAIFRPHEIGHPVGGGRMYAKGSHLEWMPSKHAYSREVMQECIFRPCLYDGHAFLLATRDEVKKFGDVIAARRGFPPCPRTRGYPVRDLLPSGGKDRLQALEAKAFQKKIGPGGEQGHYFFDISQNAGFTTMACAIPRPCTNSDIWSQRRDGPVLPHELLAAQGFAAWLSNQSVYN